MRGKKTGHRKRGTGALFPYLLITPAVVSIVLIVLYPILSAIYTSMLRYSMLSFSRPFVWFENYQRALSEDPNFWRVILNTAWWTVGSLGIGIVTSMGIALLLNQKVRGINFFRSLVLLPWAIPPVVAAIIWRTFYDPFVGLFNYLFKSWGLIEQNVGWLAQPSTALIALMVLMIWKYNPFLIAGLLAGLQAIPEELYEAGSIDGANVWQRFRFVTLPSLKTVIMILLTLNIIWRFNHFDIVWMLTKGGPGRASELLATYTYKQAFGMLDFGYGSALGIIGLLFLFVFAFLFVHLQEKQQ